MDGVSLIDGRTLAEARQAVPRAVTGFEAWTYPPVSEVARLRLAPPWLVAVVLVALATLTAAGLLRPAEPIRSPLVALLTLVYVVVVVRTWAILVARTRRWLVARPDLSDRIKLVAFVVAGSGSGLVLVVAPLAVLMLLSLFTQAVVR